MIFQLCMYYLAFTPLWIIVILRDMFSIINCESGLWTEYISIPLLVGVFIFATGYVRKWVAAEIRDNNQEYQLQSAREEKFSAVEFLISFVFPMFAFDFTRYQGVILFMMVFLIFGWLCIRHNYFCVNVVLEAMGYKVYDCSCKAFDEVLIEKKIISKRSLPQFVGNIIQVRSLNNEYMLDCYMTAIFEADDGTD